MIGEPVALDAARRSPTHDPYQFQWWALGLVGARPVEQKKGADKGIDGRHLLPRRGAKGKTKHVILSVKGGQREGAHVRDLRGVVEREKAEIGVLHYIAEPTAPMKTKPSSAGFYYVGMAGPVARRFL